MTSTHRWEICQHCVFKKVSRPRDAHVPEGCTRDDAEAIEARRIVKQQVEVGVGVQWQQRRVAAILLEAFDRDVWQQTDKLLLRFGTL